MSFQVTSGARIAKFRRLRRALRAPPHILVRRAAGATRIQEPGMRISVITVCFNAAATIGATLDSLAAQRGADVEHIVIDGGSTDGTLDAIARHAWKPARVVSEPDHGVYDAMNKGLRLATGEVVGFLNADDFLAGEGVLADVSRAMSDPQVDACYADLVYVAPEDAARVVRYWRSRPYEPGLALTGWMPAHPTFYVRRRCYETCGGFDLEFRRQADYELTTRLLEVHRLRAVYVPRIWVRMRTGGLSNRSIRGILAGNLEAYRALRKLGYRVTPFFMLRKIASRLPQYFARPSA
jgi:glycosyltransferase involved in cell wall biosynthesis